MITKNYLLAVIIIFIIFVLVIELMNYPPYISITYLVLNLLITATLVVIFILKQEKFDALKNQHLTLSNIFVLGFIIVHFQIYIDYVLGNYESFGHDYLIDTKIVSKAIVVSNIALACFSIGYITRIRAKEVFFRTIKKAKNYPNSSRVILVIAYLFFVLFMLNVDKTYFRGQYGAVDIGNAANLFQNLLIYSIYGYIVLKCRSLKIRRASFKNFLTYIRKLGISLTILLALYLPLVLLSGDRGPILQIGMVYFAGFLFLSKKKYSLGYIVIVIIVVANIISFIGLARTFTSEASYIEKVKQAQEYKTANSNSNSFSPATMELASTVRTLHASISFSDNNFYTYGVIQAFQLSAAIPGFGQLIKSITGLDESQLTSGRFLTQQIMGEDASFGLGTTCVADLYLDFGPLGIFICFFALDRFFRFLEEKPYSEVTPSLWVWVLIFVFYGKAIYIGRSAIALMFRDCTFTFLLILVSIVLGRIITKVLRKKRQNENFVCN